MRLHEFRKFERRLGIIAMLVILIGSGIFILYYSWEKSFHATMKTSPSSQSGMLDYNPPPIPQKSLSGLNRLAGTVEKSTEVRSLKEYYARRQYPGAPPHIPHPVNYSETSGGSGNCLMCHENGGYVAKWKRYAPITPHPEFTQCAQCHVEQQGKKKRRGSTFSSLKPPKLKNKSMVSSPAPIPHTLQLRKNCASCHGPGAPTELRSPHPERTLCVQCHVSQSEL